MSSRGPREEDSRLECGSKRRPEELETGDSGQPEEPARKQFEPKRPVKMELSSSSSSDRLEELIRVVKLRHSDTNSRLGFSLRGGKF